jgi:hypothetical protein
MSLGIAVIVVFILYLIDKHNRWRQAAKITLGLIIVGFLAGTCYWGWEKHNARIVEEREATQMAADEAAVRANADCLKRNAQFSNVFEECEKDPSVVLHPISVTWDHPTSSATRPQPIIGWAVVTPTDGATADIYKRCSFGVGDFPCGFVSPDFSIATLKKGDRVQVLSGKTRAANGTEIYEVKFQEWTGWMDANDLRLETP